MNADALGMIATPPPTVPKLAVLELLSREYALDGELTPLVSERDQNFRLETADGQVLVVKIANAAEPGLITDFQVQALVHLQRNACPVNVPRIVCTQAGAVATKIESGQSSHDLRVVSYVAGRPLGATNPDPPLSYALGLRLAQLDAALSDFEHPGQSQVLLWDMQRASELRGLMQHVIEADVRDLVRSCLDAFERMAIPAFETLRRQVIHNDLNPDNILIEDTAPPDIAGIIDFGDMVRGPLVIDVAIAASYIRSLDDGLESMRALVAGFESITPLKDIEKSLLFELVKMRLATTITILHWRQSARSSGDPYLQKALQERSAEQFLCHLDAMRKEAFTKCIFGPEN